MAGRYEMLPAEQEGYIGSALRNVARTGARVAESAVGAVPDLAQAGLSLVNKGVEYASGKESPLPKQIPLTSGWLRENVTKPLTGTTLEPQSKTEAAADEFFGDVAALATFPLGGAALKGSKIGWNIAKPALKKAGYIAGAGNAASLLAKSVGASEGKQTGAKVGAMLAASALSPERLSKHISGLFDTAESAIPADGGTLSVKKLWPELNKLGAKLDLGEMTPSKQFLQDRLLAIEERINKKNYNIPVDQLWELKKNSNEYIRELTQTGEKGKKAYAEKLSGLLNETLKGKESYEKYPKFAQAIDTADALETAQKQLGPVSKFLQKHIQSDKVQSGLTFALFMKPLEAAGAIAASHLVPQVEMVLRSPKMFNYYVKSLGAAIREDAPAMTRNFNKLDKELAKKSKGSLPGRYIIQ